MALLLVLLLLLEFLVVLVLPLVIGLTSGAEGSRTPDLLNAIQALSQLSYGPVLGGR
jgi:hypothetical protein